MAKTTEKKLLFLLIIFWMLLFCFSSANGADMGEIHSAETKTSYLSSSDSYQDSWTFYGDAGDRVIITTARTSGGVDPCIYLYSPSGPYEDGVCSTDNNFYLDHELEETGQYTIIIIDHNGDEEGDYGISLAKIPGAATSPTDHDGGSIASGQTLTGTLSDYADTDIFQFYGDAGDQAIITTARTSGGVDPCIYLYAPSGLYEAGVCSTDNNFYLGHELEETGLYTIIIIDHNCDEVGDYSISLTKIPSTTRPGIYNPFPSNGEIISNLCNSFSWDAVAGATGYDLYFGEDVIYPLIKIGDNLTSNSMPFPAMDINKYYYWHVVAHTPEGDIQGPYWWFETVGYEDDTIVIGLGTPEGKGYIEVVEAVPPYSHIDWVRVPWPAYNTAVGGTHPLLCNLDSDSEDELVVGLDSYPTKGGYVEIRDDATTGYAHLSWIRVSWPVYNADNGATYPTCGDFDGDGKNELAIGLGTYPTTGGYVEIRDDSTTGYVHLEWVRVPWPAYNSANGATHPAAGDFDGDGKDELAIGLGTYTARGGYVEIIDDAATGFAHLAWQRVPWPNYNTANGATHPIAGDFDGDCKDELAIGLGTYTARGGYVEIIDDAGMGFSHLAWPRVPWPAYNAANGATYPAAGSFDGDNNDELFIGLGAYPDKGGYVEVKDDNSTGYTHMGWPRVHWPAYNSANGETRPSPGH